MSADLWPDPVTQPAAEQPALPRAQLAAEAVFWAAVADEARARGALARESLDMQARQELTRDGIAPTWRIPGVGTVPLALSADRVDVADEAAYTEWVAASHPTEVETIVTTRVRPAFDAHLRAGAAKRSAACDEQGQAIPGLAFVAGGTPKGISIRPSTDARAEAAHLAAAALDGIFSARDVAAQLTGKERP